MRTQPIVLLIVGMPWLLSQRVPASADAAVAAVLQPAGGGSAPLASPPTFVGLLSEIALRHNVAIVAEGVPLHASLPPGGIPPITGAQPSDEDAVRAVATAFDYDVTMDGPVFALSKRYTDPSDLPSVTIGEWLRSLREVQRLVGPLNPHVDMNRWVGGRSPAIGELAASLSTGQLADLGGAGLPLRALHPAQVALVRRLALYFFVQEGADRSAAALDCLENAEPSVVFRFADVSGGNHLFGFDFTRSSGLRPLFEPLAGQFSGAGVIIHGKVQPPAPDPTDPGEMTGDLTYPALITIEKLTEELTASGQGHVSVEVDPALGSKLLTVVGAANAQPEGVMSAVASVYGLELKAQNDGRITLLRLGFHPKPVTPTLAQELPAAVVHVLPRPLLRALHAMDLRELVLQEQAIAYRSYRIGPSSEEPRETSGPLQPWEDETLLQLGDAMRDRAIGERRKQLFQQFNKALDDSDLRPGALKIAALRRLRALVEPKVRASPGGRVPLSSLGELEQDAFATVVVSDCWSCISDWIGYPAPDYIGDFEGITLTGGLTVDSRGLKRIALFFTFPSPNGKLDRREAGFGGVPYVK